MSTSRNRILRLSWLAVNAVLMLTATLAYGQAPVFTKTLKKVNGIDITSPPASLSNGDVLDWVMTYQFTQPALANIQDLLPPTLQYVTGSLQVPPSWTRKWLVVKNQSITYYE